MGISVYYLITNSRPPLSLIPSGNDTVQEQRAFKNFLQSRAYQAQNTWCMGQLVCIENYMARGSLLSARDNTALVLSACDLV